MNYFSEKVRIDDLGRIYIPKEIRRKLKIQEGDILEITATENLIVIEEYEEETED